MSTTADTPVRTNPAARRDRAAIALSLVCIAHCVALPVLAIALPFAAAAAEAEWVHWLFACGAILASASVLATQEDARVPSFLLPAGVGVLLIGGALFAEGFGIDETLPTILGGFLVAIAHVQRLMKR